MGLVVRGSKSPFPRPEMADLIETGHSWYPQRLERFILELRRLRFDLVQVYKMVNGLGSLKLNEFFDTPDERTRGHSKRLREKRGLRDSRQHFFAYRVVRVWNSLSEGTVTAGSLTRFKTLLSSENLAGFLRACLFRAGRYPQRCG